MLSLSQATLVLVSSAVALSPSAVRHDIQQHGAQVVVDRMWKSGAWDQVVIPRVSSGSAPWIRLAPALSVGTDGGASEELGQSLTDALPKSPAAVLSVLDLTGKSLPRSPERVCSASFYEGDPTNPATYKPLARRAVLGVADPALRRAKQACLSRLR